MDLVTIVKQLETLGAFRYLFPFLLVFAIVFGILEKIGIFKNKSINAVIAIAIGLFAIYSNSFYLMTQRFMPNVSMVIVTALAFLLIFGLWYGKSLEGSNAKYLFWVGLVIAFLGIGWSLFAGYNNQLQRMLNLSPDSIYLLLMGSIVVVVVLIFAFKKDVDKGDYPKMDELSKKQKH
ncbi:hypothetical protein J4468_03565 [Candidatus Woesearchaeota archaeon]|nr:hypothetical protein [Candidatus Woesearchaeota archaeon]